MGSITLRIRSIVWFVTGAVIATTVTLMFINAWRVDAAPGDDDSTFVPIAPCRLVDTREPGGAALQPGEIRTIEAHGTNGPIVDSQCTIPTDAVALSMNVTAVAASTRTFWTFWADGTPQPTASSLNPAPNQPPTPNAVTAPLSPIGRFNVFNNRGAVGMVIDVNGYYTKASLTDLASRLAAVEATAATNASGVAANTAAVGVLDNAQPFTTINETSTRSIAQSGWTDIIEVPVTATTTGKVTVIASAYAIEFSDGQFVGCGINDANAEPLFPHQKLWTSGTGVTGEYAAMTPVRTFDINEGQTATYYLMCANLSGGTSTVSQPVISAIFTPAP